MSETITCADCGKGFNSEVALSQHAQVKHNSKPVQESGKKINKFALSIFAVAFIITVFSYFAYANSLKPGQYDNFAKCLTATGAVVYGNDFCQYTNKQLNWFGKSWKHLNYVRCAENKELCQSKGIDVTPTWEINGKLYEEVQTFEKLSEITGCNLS